MSTIGPCPKCGEDYWRFPATYIREQWCDTFPGESPKPFKLCDEHLRFTCACGYTVTRPCMDANKTNASA